ncbi:hypothetical protein WME94_27020 [Sorangium sp. So ce429]
MTVVLDGSPSLALFWWWERPPADAESLHLDGFAARAYFGRVARSPVALASLRRLVVDPRAALGDLRDGTDVVDVLARAVASGRLRVARLRRSIRLALGGEARALESWTPEPRTPPRARSMPPVEDEDVEAPPPPRDECLACRGNARATAAALRDAAKHGVPFIVDIPR